MYLTRFLLIISIFGINFLYAAKEDSLRAQQRGHVFAVAQPHPLGQMTPQEREDWFKGKSVDGIQSSILHMMAFEGDVEGLQNLIDRHRNDGGEFFTAGLAINALGFTAYDIANGAMLPQNLGPDLDSENIGLFFRKAEFAIMLGEIGLNFTASEVAELE